jgi:gliding motility associated protien GldN
MKKLLLIFTVLFYLNGFSQQGVFTPGDYRDGVYDKENAVMRRPIPYTHLRQGDVTWEKRVWRKIDMREKLNQPMYYPLDSMVGRVSLLQVIVRGILSQKIKVFEDDEFQQVLDTGMFLRMICIPGEERESEIFDSLGNAQIITVNIPPRCDWIYQNFCSLELKEDWFFDKQKSSLEVRIIGMGFGFMNPNAAKAAMFGCENKFFVYFPECRPLLARNEVFNTKNDSERRTYDDLFWKRQFTSTVSRESNVFNRNITAYTAGLDALIESDRIKGDIFRFEHDLWQF